MQSLGPAVQSLAGKLSATRFNANKQRRVHTRVCRAGACTVAEHVCHTGMQSLSPAVQYLAGELSVEAGIVLPLVASHNTVRMLFCVEDQCIQVCIVQVLAYKQTQHSC